MIELQGVLIFLAALRLYFLSKATGLGPPAP